MNDEDIVKCPECVKLKKQSKVFPGVRAIHYISVDKTVTIDFRCSNEHEWTERESLPQPPRKKEADAEKKSVFPF